MGTVTTPMPTVKEKMLNEKPVETLVLLRRRGPSYPRRLSQKTDTTYSHMVRLLGELQKSELVTNEKRGRKKVYTLTEKGRQVGDKLLQLEGAPGIEFSYMNEDEAEEKEKKPRLRETLQESYS